MPTGAAACLEHDDVVTARACDTRRFQPCGAGTNDDDFAAVGAVFNDVGHRKLPPRRGIVDAQRFAALIDAVQTVVRPDAGADIMFAAFNNLAHHVGVGHVRAGHAAHVQKARSDGVPCGGDVLDFGGVECRHAGRAPDLTGEIQMRGRRHPLDRDHVRHGRVGMDPTPDYVEEIDLARIAQQFGNLDTLFGRDATRLHLVRRIANADDEFGSDPFAHGGKHIGREAQPVFQRIRAVGTVQLVGQRRPELVH